MESLEKYILQNRADFDKAVPSLRVWAEIDKNLSQKRHLKVRRWRVLKIAAAVTILLMCGAVGGFQLKENLLQQADSLADVAPEYAELEQFYHEEVNDKIKVLTSYHQANMVQEDLKRLDDLFMELMEEYKNAPKGSEEQIIQAMINNYQTKVNILETVLNRIQSTEHSITPIQNQIEKDDKSISI